MFSIVWKIAPDNYLKMLMELNFPYKNHGKALHSTFQIDFLNASTKYQSSHSDIDFVEIGLK